jgi:hypothetical protein
MEKPDAYYIAARLSDRDAKELKLLDRGLRTNEPLAHDRAAVADLIELELARSSGIAVRITEIGYQVLRFL